MPNAALQQPIYYVVQKKFSLPVKMIQFFTVYLKTYYYYLALFARAGSIMRVCKKYKFQIKCGRLTGVHFLISRCLSKSVPKHYAIIASMQLIPHLVKYYGVNLKLLFCMHLIK